MFKQWPQASSLLFDSGEREEVEKKEADRKKWEDQP